MVAFTRLLYGPWLIDREIIKLMDSSAIDAGFGWQRRDGAMRYELTVNFDGPIDADSINGGATSLLLAGNGRPPLSTDDWQLHARLSPTEAAEGRPKDADIEIWPPMDGSLSGSFLHGTVTRIPDETGNSPALKIDLTFGVADSSGSFAGATGSIRLYGTVQKQGLLVSADLLLDAPSRAWMPPEGRILSPADAAAGASLTLPEHDTGADDTAEAAEVAARERLRRR